MGHEGAAVTLFVVSALYLVFTIALTQVHVPPIRRAAAGGGLETLSQGIKYVGNDRIFLLLILTSFSNAFFGGAHMTLLPVFADKLLGEATGVSLAVLASAGGVGGLTGAIVGGSLGRLRRRGWLLVGAASTYGVTLVLFALSPFYWLLVGLEWMASASNQMFNVTSQSTLHGLVPDEYRGRVMGLWSMTHSVAQPMGGLQMGGVASQLGATASVIISASFLLGCVALGIGRDGRVRNLTSAQVIADSELQAKRGTEVGG